MSFLKTIQNFISQNRSTENNNQATAAVPIAKFGSHSYMLIESEKGTVGRFKLANKVSSIKTFSSNILDRLQGTVVKIRGQDISKDKSSHYYVRIQDICSVCGLLPEQVKMLKDQGKLERMIQISAQMHKAFKGSEVEEFQKIQRKYFDKVISLLNENDISGLDLMKIIQNYDFDTYLRDFNLSDQDISKLKYLTNYVPVKNLKNLLEQEPEKKILLKTFCNASDVLKKNNGFTAENIYEKGVQSESFTFMLTADRQFIIMQRKTLAEGGYTRVKETYNVTNPEEEMVQKVSRGNDTVKDIQTAEKGVLKEIYEAKCPYILKQSKITYVGKGKLKNPDTGRGIIDTNEPKLVSLDPKQRSGHTIFEGDIPLIAQFYHDMVKGLVFLHSRNMAHGDIKPDNALIKNGRAVLADLSSITKKHSWPLDDGTIYTEMPNSFQVGHHIFAPPEQDQDYAKGYTKHSREKDNYSVGFSIVDSLYTARKRGEIYSLIRENKEKPEKIREYFDELRKEVDQERLPDDYKEAKKQLISIAEKLLVYKPEDRITSQETLDLLKKIPFVNQEDPPY